MFSFWIDSDAVAKPNFFTLTDVRARMLLHEGNLDRQLIGQPKIVRIEKCQIASARLASRRITRRRHASIRLLQNHQPRAELGELLHRVIGGAVINHD